MHQPSIKPPSTKHQAPSKTAKLRSTTHFRNLGGISEKQEPRRPGPIKQRVQYVLLYYCHCMVRGMLVGGTYNNMFFCPVEYQNTAQFCTVSSINGVYGMGISMCIV